MSGARFQIPGTSRLRERHHHRHQPAGGALRADEESGAHQL